MNLSPDCCFFFLFIGMDLKFDHDFFNQCRLSNFVS